MSVENVLAKTDSFEDLLQVANHTVPHLSFWGKQYLTVEGHEGILELSSLSSRVNEIAKKKKYVYSDRERNIGRHLITVLHKILTVADFQLYLCNFLTLFFAALRNFDSKMREKEKPVVSGLY